MSKHTDESISGLTSITHEGLDGTTSEIQTFFVKRTRYNNLLINRAPYEAWRREFICVCDGYTCRKLLFCAADSDSKYWESRDNIIKDIEEKRTATRVKAETSDGNRLLRAIKRFFK